MVKIRKETYDKIKDFSNKNYNINIYSVIDMLVDNYLDFKIIRKFLFLPILIGKDIRWFEFITIIKKKPPRDFKSDKNNIKIEEELSDKN